MKTKNWENRFRERIEKSGLSLCEIARQTGVSSAQLSRFMRGERGLRIPTAEKLADCLGLALVETEPIENRQKIVNSRKNTVKKRK